MRDTFTKSLHLTDFSFVIFYSVADGGRLVGLSGFGSQEVKGIAAMVRGHYVIEKGFYGLPKCKRVKFEVVVEEFEGEGEIASASPKRAQPTVSSEIMILTSY